MPDGSNTPETPKPKPVTDSLTKPRPLNQSAPENLGQPTLQDHRDDAGATPGVPAKSEIKNDPTNSTPPETK